MLDLAAAGLQKSNRSLPAISSLASFLTRPVTIFDVETNRGHAKMPGFRIIEVGLVHVLPGGEVYEGGSFVSDEGRGVPKFIENLTGISAAMLTGAPTWGQRWSKVFADIASNDLSAGYNSAAFDCHAVRACSRKAGDPEPVFDAHLDVRRLPGVFGGLGVAAARHGIIVQRAHRALDDAWTTALLMDKVLESCGAAYAKSKIRPSPAPPKAPKAPKVPKGKSKKVPAKAPLNPAQLQLFSLHTAKAAPTKPAPTPNSSSNESSKPGDERDSASEAQRRAILRMRLRNELPIDLVRFAARFKVSLAVLQEDCALLREELKNPGP